MNFLDKVKSRSFGCWAIIVASILSLAAMIAYSIFAAGAGVFNSWIFICFLVAAVLGFVLLFYDGYVSDFIGIAIAVFLTAAVGILLADSIGDFADFIVKIRLYGNMDNAPARVAIIVISVIGIVADLIGCFTQKSE